MSDSLEFRLLKCIVSVAETFNFTRAAERLFLAQPSLSKQIRDLSISPSTSCSSLVHFDLCSEAR